MANQTPSKNVVALAISALAAAIAIACAVRDSVADRLADREPVAVAAPAALDTD